MLDDIASLKTKNSIPSELYYFKLMGSQRTLLVPGLVPSTDADWPIQTSPNDKTWGLWRKALSDSICDNNHRYVLASRPGLLKQRLGAWLSTSTPKKSPRWQFVLAHSTQKLYIPANGHDGRYYQLFTATRLDFNLATYNLRDLPNLQQTLKPEAIPADAVPVLTTTDGELLRVNKQDTPVLQGPMSAPATIRSFDDYIQALPRWKWELLCGAFPTKDYDGLALHLVQATPLWMCSDGGAKGNTGSFGWVIATSTTILWECLGIAIGWFAYSFRSEGVGQLSLLVFLEAYIQYHQLHDLQLPTQQIDETPQSQIATDNKGLIARILTGIQTTTPFAGAALSVEYDVVNEIVETERRLPFRPTWEHVKSHQDDRKKWYELQWMETLNVLADKHATAGLVIPGRPSTLITQIPSSKIALRIQHTDITSHYATHLRKASARPATLHHFLKHYGWDKATFDTADWKAHHGAIRKLRFAGKKFITKFIHQSLPMGAVFHKIEPTQAITCSSCKTHSEGEAHLYQYTARRLVMDTFLDVDLEDFLQANHTCPALAHILLDSLHCEIRGTHPAFQRQHGVHDPAFSDLLQAQTKLGWSQLFQGRLVENWSHLQERFLADNNDDLELVRRYFTGNIWARKLISLLWLAIRAQWNLRNTDRHGRTTEANHAIRHKRLLTSIQTMYKDAPLMLAADHTILPPSPTKHKQHPTSLERWLKCTQAIVERSKTDATMAIQRTHERLHHFFRHRCLKKSPTLADPSIVAIT
jgi:hypothetical protein